MVRLFLLLLPCVLLAARPAAAQQEPFGTLEFRAAATQNVQRNFLHDFWEPGVGAEASVATPFYLGYAEFGGAFHRYDVVQPTVPAFDAVSVHAGWGLDAQVGRFHAEAGVRVGNYRMTFEEITFAGVRNESELALGGQGRLSVRVAGPVALYVGGSYTKVFTFLRLNLWFASAGLSVRLRTPAWAREVLR